MCLGIPGRIASLEAGPEGMTLGKIDFNGVVKDACLAYVPEAKVGDYAIIHAGFAISLMDEEEARGVFAVLEELGQAESP